MLLIVPLRFPDWNRLLASVCLLACLVVGWRYSAAPFNEAFARGDWAVASMHWQRAPLRDGTSLKSYLQLLHLTQGQALPSPVLACSPDDVSCLRAQTFAQMYDGVEIHSRDVATARLIVGQDGHRLLEVSTSGASGRLVLDTGSVVTLLPRTLHGAVEQRLHITRVHNLGRGVPIALVRTAPLSVAGLDVSRWVAAIAASGFEEEGVLGLDMLYALGGIELYPKRGVVRFLHGRCAKEGGVPLRTDNGALTAQVTINGAPHLALVDTGSVRSFVYNSAGVLQPVTFRSDFGNVSLPGEFRSSSVVVGDFARRVDVMHTNEASRFYGQTTAIVGNDVLMRAALLRVCFNPARLWIE